MNQISISLPTGYQPRISLAAQGCFEGETHTPANMTENFFQHQPTSAECVLVRLKRLKPFRDEVGIHKNRACRFIRKKFPCECRFPCPVRALDDNDSLAALAGCSAFRLKVTHSPAVSSPCEF